MLEDHVMENTESRALRLESDEADAGEPLRKSWKDFWISE